ncbi:hypothetical protein OXX80_002437 [Metschnikowia pulcherrima]
MHPNQPNGSRPPYHSYSEPLYSHGPSADSSAATHAPPAGPSRNDPTVHHNGPSNPPNSALYAYSRYPYPSGPPGAPHIYSQAPQMPSALYSQAKVPMMSYPPPLHQQSLAPVPVSVGETPSSAVSAHIMNDPPSGTAVPDRHSFSSASHHSNEPADHEQMRPVHVASHPETDTVTGNKTYVKKEAYAPSPSGGKLKQSVARKRSSTACDKCRQKKIKCDNVKPRCGACTRAGITDCHYGADTSGGDTWFSDAAYSGLSSKLDLIMDELRAQKETSTPTKRRRLASDSARAGNWDASFTSLIKWPFLQQQLGISAEDVDRHVTKIVTHCDTPNIATPVFGSIKEQIDAITAAEFTFHTQFSAHLNAYLVNSHTKLPFLDIVQLIESLEVFRLVRKVDNSVTFFRLLREFYSLKNTEPVGEIYKKSLAELGIEDSKVLQEAYKRLCESAHIVLMACAIGVISAPVSLNNIGTYENSLEERSVGPAPEHDRFILSQMYVNYAQALTGIFPQSAKAFTMVSIKYHVLLSQYYHYTMNPSMAHEEIVIASDQLVYYIEKAESRARLCSDQTVHSRDDALMNRLYWTCLKLECEVRVELSPYVPPSPIFNVTPPSSFFRIPDPFHESEHTEQSIRIANKYDDQNTWYFFLTEIAARKIDNSILDEFYSAWSEHFTWDDDDFVRDKVWRSTIKYSNQLNGIVDSLTPAIRNFVLHETDPEQIYASIKRKALKRKKVSDDEDKVPQILDDFLVDEDMLHHAQSESVMFIKTRILSSKMLLMRPLAYMYLHDHIQFEEIMEAALEVVAQASVSQSEKEIISYEDPSGTQGESSAASEDSIYQSAAALNFLNHEDGEALQQPRSSSFGLNKKFRLDDFTDLADFAEGIEALDESHANYEVARKRILKAFIGAFIAMPKLNIPRLGSFRHPGSWYYIRNLLLGVMMVFLIYKKTQNHVVQMANNMREKGLKNPSPEAMEVLSSIFKKESVHLSLEHALLIIDYWKDERKDCAIYGEYLRQCLERL